MPKILNEFTVHIQDPTTSIEYMYEYLTKVFGPPHDDTTKRWYLGRNYERPRNESVIEITFYGDRTKKHTLMMLEHPYTILSEDTTEWFEVNDQLFSNLFEETA